MAKHPTPAKAPPVVTLGDALALAAAYWETKGFSSRMMPIRAKRCAMAIGLERELDSLGPVDGTLVLSSLAKPQRVGPLRDLDRLAPGVGHKLARLSKASQASYYAAFTRMLALAGISTVAWPSAPTPPRSVRDPLTGEDLDRLHAEFIARGWPETASLLTLLRLTGMRVEVEALNSRAFDWAAGGQSLKITGKGGHERVVPVGPRSGVLAASHWEELRDMQRLSYSCHLKRWRKAVDALGIISRLPTPHAVRHFYATKAYKRCKDLRTVQELLGHADPATTARYIGVDMEKLREAAGLGSNEDV